MPIVWIGQSNVGDELFIGTDQRIAHMPIHQSPCAFETTAVEIRTDTQGGSDPLFMNGCRPLGTEEVGNRQFQQDIPQRRRVKHASIQKDNEGAHANQGGTP